MIKSVENITYNGVDLAAEFTGPNNAYFVVNYVRGRGVMPEALELVSVPGMAGSYLTDSGTPERIIEVDITMKGESFTDLRRRIEKLDSVLRSGNGAAVPIQFDDEPDRIYFGTLEDVSHRVEVSHIYQATITLICPDPHKYGTEQSAPSDEPGSGRNYVLGSEISFSWSDATTATNYETLQISDDIKDHIKKDNAFVLSYDVKTTNGFKKGSVNPYVGMEFKYIATDDIARYVVYNAIAFGDLPDGENDLRLSRRFLISGDLKEFNYLRVYFRDFSGTATLSNFKIELGDTATPWSPAPEDTGILKINNEGSAESYPIVEVKLKKPTPFVSISNGHDINMIGEIPDAEEPVYEKYQNIMMDYLKTTVGWAKIKFPPYTGTITDGIISADSQGFFPSSYGYVPGLEWHGPALAKSLPEPLQDLYMHFSSYLRATDPASVGRQELYALDAVNKPVMSLHFIKDSYGKVVRPEVIVYNSRGEPRRILSLNRDQVPDWKDFYGYISIVREGRRIVAQAEESAGLFGGVRDRRIQIYEDVKEEYQRPVVSVAVVFQAYRQSPALNRNRAERVSMDKIVQKEGVPYIATTGDVITFDHPQNVIYKNGIDVKKEKAFIGQYFALKPGENALAIEPADAIESMKVRWRDRWL